MAAPNLANITKITGNTNVQTVTTTATAIVTNQSSSNQVFKLNTLTCANVSNINVALCTTEFYRNSVAYPIASNVQIPPQATLMVVGKDAPFYLEEGDAIRLRADYSNTVVAVASFEVLG